MRNKPARVGHGYAWQIRTRDQWEMCNWAAPTREQLEKLGKPSPEARIVKVVLVPLGQWRDKPSAAALACGRDNG